MKALALAVGSALIGLATIVADQRLVFAPAPGSRLSKSFETTLEFDIDKLAITYDGEDYFEDLLARIMAQASTELSASIQVVDTYIEVEGGQLSWSQRDAALKGVDLTFLWDTKSESYELAADIQSLDLVP